jgi:hypothetical protein
MHILLNAPPVDIGPRMRAALTEPDLRDDMSPKRSIAASSR